MARRAQGGYEQVPVRRRFLCALVLSCPLYFPLFAGVFISSRFVLSPPTPRNRFTPSRCACTPRARAELHPLLPCFDTSLQLRRSSSSRNNFTRTQRKSKISKEVFLG